MHSFNRQEGSIFDNNFSVFNAYKINKITIYEGNDDHHIKILIINKEFSDLNVTPVTKENDYSFGNRPRELDIKIDFNVINMITEERSTRSILIYFHKGVYSIRWDDEKESYNYVDSTVPMSLTKDPSEVNDICLHASRIRIYNKKDNNRDKVLTILGACLDEYSIKIENVNKENNYWFGNNIGELDFVMDFYDENNDNDNLEHLCVDKTLEVCSMEITSQIRWK